MNERLRSHCDGIIKQAISAVQPKEAVIRALRGKSFNKGRIVLVAAGKAAWSMAKAACDELEGKIDKGVIVTKYGHVVNEISGIECVEAGHPVLDSNSVKGCEKVLKIVSGLTKDDTVLFLLSGGGSALFEKPLVSLKELQDITSQLLACGADIVEINTIRKRLSAVKGGKFAQYCSPARVFTIVLSDIIGDPLDMIASGPAYPDSSTCSDAFKIIKKYDLRLSEKALWYLGKETPKYLSNVETYVTGSVSQLCRAAGDACWGLGYKPIILTDRLTCVAEQAGIFLSSIAQTHYTDKKYAYIAGGETVVQLKGNGLGGRNQELALSAAPGLRKIKNAAVFSFGSDGTDGPTDAAGGYVDGDTFDLLTSKGISIDAMLKNNDSYNALKACNGLIKTGPTGTNVNDVSILLIE